MSQFTVDSGVRVRIKRDQYTDEWVECRNYAAAEVVAFEALKSGALSVEIIPA